MKPTNKTPYRQTPRVRKAKPKKSRSFLFWLVAMLVIVIAIGAGLLLTHKAFNIKYIRVDGNDTIPTADIVNEMGEINDNIFLFSDQDAINRVLKIPGIDEATIQKEFPNRIILQVKETYAIASMEVGEETLHVNQDGVLMEGVSEELTGRYKPLKIEGLGDELEIGDKITEDDRVVPFLKNLLKTELSDGIEKVIFEKIDNIDIIYKDIEIRFGPPDDINEKIAIILAVLENIEEKNIRAEEIILNEGSNPIVVYEN